MGDFLRFKAIDQGSCLVAMVHGITLSFHQQNNIVGGGRTTEAGRSAISNTLDLGVDNIMLSS